MERQPTPMNDQITGEDLAESSLEELEELFLAIYASLEKIFHTMSSSAQGRTQIEAQRLALLGLENVFKEGWPVLKATVEAIIYHAIFPDEDNQKQKKKAKIPCHTMTDDKRKEVSISPAKET